MAKRQALVLAVCAACLVGVVVLTGQGHGTDVLEYVPHVGLLTQMVDDQKVAALKEVGGDGSARTQQLHMVVDEADASHNARQWAQRQLRSGLSKSESASGTATTKESGSRQPRSISTRGYSNTHSGYTSSIPETRGGADDDAYAFVKSISKDKDERSDAYKAKTQLLSEVPEGRRERGRHLPRSLYSRRYSNTHSGYTSQVAEHREAADDSAWDFASRLERSSRALRRDSATAKRTAAVSDDKARTQDLDLVDDSHSQDMQDQAETAWEWANDNSADAESGRTAGRSNKASRGRRAQYASPSWEGEKAVYRPSGRAAPSGFTSAISEGKDPADESAWGWASDAMLHNGRHRHMRESGRIVRHYSRKSKNVAAEVKQIEKAKEAEEEAVGGAMDATKARAVSRHVARHSTPTDAEHLPHAHRPPPSSLLQAMEATARKEIDAIHRATTEAESRHLVMAKQMASARMSEIEAKNMEQQAEADAGAQDELSQYGTAASLGVPTGAGSSESVLKTIKDWSISTGGKRHDMAAASSAAAAARTVAASASPVAQEEPAAEPAPVAMEPVAAPPQLAVGEEAEVYYHEGFEAGLKEAARDEKEVRGDVMSESNEAGKKDRTLRAIMDMPKKLKAMGEARMQSLADNTWDDADPTFQVEGSRWGPSSGDWA